MEPQGALELVLVHWRLELCLGMTSCRTRIPRACVNLLVGCVCVCSVRSMCGYLSLRQELDVLGYKGGRLGQAKGQGLRRKVGGILIEGSRESMGEGMIPRGSRHSRG